MHYHTEIIMPPTDDIEATIAQIMAPFDENREEEGQPNRHGFWDFYVIGGRYSGHKLMATLGDMTPFYELLQAKSITVSSLQFGKRTLQPACQASRVDALWNETFPESPVKVCPIFDNYKDDYGDVMLVKDLPASMTAEVVIIAGPSWEGEKIEATTLLRDSVWNGVTHQDTKWDRTLTAALTQHAEQYRNAKNDYRARHTVGDDWLVVTVDYHS